MYGKPTVLLLVVALSGCASDQPSRGWVRSARVGSEYPDFVFVDDDGVRRTLGNQLGDYTILAFTRCDRDAHGPVSAVLKAIVDENRTAPLVKISGLDIHWFGGQCDHSQCHLITGERNLQSICDATGSVRRLFGIGASDRYVVIGPSHRIDMAVDARDVSRLRQQLKAWVSQLSDQGSRELSQEYQTIGY